MSVPRSPQISQTHPSPHPMMRSTQYFKTIRNDCCSRSDKFSKLRAQLSIGTRRDGSLFEPAEIMSGLVTEPFELGHSVVFGIRQSGAATEPTDVFERRPILHST